MKDTPNISKTIKNKRGQIILFGSQHFLDDIAKGDCCFICGEKPTQKEFNDEHIISDWIIKKYNLNNKTITLPNATRFKYNNYKVPCCRDCNSELGKTYEQPISLLLSKPYNEICEEITKDPKICQLLFKWLSLIFFKTHLKDKTLLAERDKRIDAGFISDNYDWEDIHHIHCIARSHYTKAQIDNNVFGTLYIFPALADDKNEGFDYLDDLYGKTIMLKLGEFCIISVLNDSGAGFQIFDKQLSKIKGPLSSLQIIDVFAHLTFININLKESPKYYSRFSHPLDEHQIKLIPSKSVELLDKKDWFITSGEILRKYVEPRFGEVQNKDKILKEIEENRRNYLFDIDGNFIKNEL